MSSEQEKHVQLMLCCALTFICKINCREEIKDLFTSSVEVRLASLKKSLGMALDAEPTEAQMETFYKLVDEILTPQKGDTKQAEDVYTWFCRAKPKESQGVVAAACLV